jgi:hypothetical protein
MQSIRDLTRRVHMKKLTLAGITTMVATLAVFTSSALASGPAFLGPPVPVKQPPAVVQPNGLQSAVLPLPR